MFILTTISDVVQIVPQDFRKKSIDAIEDNLNQKYSNKVIQNGGLAICVYDILKVSDGIIGQDAGKINVNVEFRLIMFRPFRGEIIMGRISSSGKWGIRVRLDFFEDIYVPENMLIQGSHFIEQEACWGYEADGHLLHYDKGEWVCIRIESETFHDNAPPPPSERADVSNTERKSPYSITASMSESGLGPMRWWVDPWWEQ